MTRQVEIRRRVRDRMERSRTEWSAAARPRPFADRRTPAEWLAALHVTNGDCTVPALRGTGLAERILVWRDALHEGPVPSVPDDELRRVRAAFLAADDPLVDEDGAQAERRDALGALEERDAALAAARDGEYVLWFEADLYDQLQLVQILARLRGLAVPPDRITLLCIGEYPGIAHFGGLGQLDASQLRVLPELVAAPLTPAALAHAERAWAAFRAPEPTELEAIARTPSGELRFLAEAFDRLGREFPSTRDGLSLGERRVLAAVAGGAPTAGAAFVRASAREARPYLGDLWCFRAIARLVHAPTPLLALADPAARIGPETALAVTDPGRRVLRAELDHVALNGIDRWLGGVHLAGAEAAWRWDEGMEAVTEAAR
jgi:hypothetical protein